VLATSREPLRLRGETVVTVAPLALPEASAAADLNTLADVPAVALFVSCAREARPDFGLTETNAAAVAEICRRLDGLPLALQLAAARLTVLSPEGLLARLEHRLSLLTRGPRDLPERQQTLRAAIAWSYDMLGAAEQRLFRQLGAFVGFTLEAVEALIDGGADDLDPLEAISTLVGQSLVVVQPLEETTPRADLSRGVVLGSLGVLAALRGPGGSFAAVRACCWRSPGSARWPHAAVSHTALASCSVPRGPCFRRPTRWSG